MPTRSSTVFSLLLAIGSLCFTSSAFAQFTASRGFQLESTIGLDSQECSQTRNLTLPEGSHEVIVCLRASNFNRTEFVLHDLLSEELGVLVSDLHYTLSPGTSFFYTFAFSVSESTGLSSAWIARGLNGKFACNESWSVVTVGRAWLTEDARTLLLCP